MFLPILHVTTALSRPVIAPKVRAVVEAHLAQFPWVKTKVQQVGNNLITAELRITHDEQDPDMLYRTLWQARENSLQCEKLQNDIHKMLGILRKHYFCMVELLPAKGTALRSFISRIMRETKKQSDWVLTVKIINDNRAK